MIPKALKLYIRTEAAHAAGKEFQEYKELFVELGAIVTKELVHNEEAIVLYDAVLGLMLPGQYSIWGGFIGRMRWNAVKASPKDAQIAITHFQACLSNQDLAHAQVVSLLAIGSRPYYEASLLTHFHRSAILWRRTFLKNTAMCYGT